MNPRTDLEQRIVASILVGDDGWAAIRKAGATLDPGDLVSIPARYIAGSSKRLHDAGLPNRIDAVRIDLETRGELETVGGAAFLGSLIDGTPVNGNLAGMIDMLREVPEVEPELPDLAIDANRTDCGAGRAFVAVNGRDVRHVYGEGWRAFDGKRWARDEMGEIVRRAKATADLLLRAAVGVRDEAARKLAVKWALSLHSEARLTAMVNLAASEPGVTVTRDAFDRDHFLLNVQNGTIDLHAGELRPHQRTDLLSKLAPVEYDAEAACPKWRAFLDRTFAGNADLISFVQRAIGYSLTGSTREQVLFLHYGTGANGKSTMLGIVRDTIGDYGREAPAEIFMAHRNDQHPTGIAGLHGARFVTAIETDDGRRLAEGLIKSLTGGDRVAARFMKRDFFEFQPTFKLHLAVNHKPAIRGTDHAIWRRIRLVPYTVTIPEAERDRDLPDKLRAELPGILRWAAEGCIAYMRDGLGEPPAVTEATAGYRRDQDLVGAFLEAECTRGESYSVSKKALYAAYREWAESNGEHALTQRKLSERLTEIGIEGTRDMHGRHWRSLGLLSDREDMTQ
jgi:putative DNA primase/helicase